MTKCGACGHWHGGTGNEPGNPCTHYVDTLKAECGCTAGLTARQRELARHALGLPNKMRMSYRNRFVAGLGHDDYEEWMRMVSTGLAERREGKRLPFAGDDLFWLTEWGARLALEPREKLDPEDFTPRNQGRLKNRLDDGPPLPRRFQ